MSTATPPHAHLAQISLDHYHHMVRCGAFEHGLNTKHVELLYGTIYDKYGSEPARFTVDEYEHMIAVGAFDEPYNIKAELLFGEIVMMSPIGEPHSLVLTEMNEWSFEVANLQEVMIRVQMPIRIPALKSEPEPDLAWVRRESRGNKPPEPADVLLLVEAADSSLAKDRGTKLAAYAAAGISDYWIVNLVEKQIEVFREPKGSNYSQSSVFSGTEAVAPLVLPSARLEAQRFFALLPS